MAREWYSYDGTGDLDQLSSYTLSSGNPACVNGTTVCAIFALNGAQNPSILSSNLQMYISDIGIRGLAQPEDPGAKRYVYGKS